jgi:hypothetical protein
MITSIIKRHKINSYIYDIIKLNVSFDIITKL